MAWPAVVLLKNRFPLYVPMRSAVISRPPIRWLRKAKQIMNNRDPHPAQDAALINEYISAEIMLGFPPAHKLDSSTSDAERGDATKGALIEG